MRRTLCLIAVLLGLIGGLPVPRGSWEKSLDDFLETYYDMYYKGEDEGLKKNEEDIYEGMQGDQPAADRQDPKGVVLGVDPQQGGNISDDEALAREKDRRTKKDIDKRLRKESWRQYLKIQLLTHLNPPNQTKIGSGTNFSNMNMSQIMSNITRSIDDRITEKIRSFYPSCEPPANADQDLWKDEEIMNLYFDVDYLSSNSNSNIATATLRLYRVPQNATNKLILKKDDCDNAERADEEILLRVSVYWYTKLQKKRRVKRRLSDSKMMPDDARWVELSVKPATKAWNKAGAKNLGLGILVEDQEGKTLRADKFFKGASCTVGVSTPKPIPTIFLDAANLTSEFKPIQHLLGGNSTATLHSDVYLLPSIDICFLEFPDNSTSANFDSIRVNACNLRKIHEENQRLAEKEHMERLASLSLMPHSRHIRHQRQYLANKMAEGASSATSQLALDLRSRISDSKVILNREELENFTQDKFINR